MTGGRRLGSSYLLVDQIGSGAMGAVWQGRDDAGTAFAFKLLRTDFADDQRVVDRFIQERAILTGLRHRNLVAVHDLVAEGSTLAIVMDLVPGPDLRTVIARAGTVTPAEAAELCAGVAAGLAAAHEAGVYHRDIKPENVLVDESGGKRVARVVDFGIARLAQGDTPSVRSTMMVGTPQYMAPETADGAPPGAAADVYALGVVLYELCCGVTPFASGSTWATIKQHIERAPGRPDGVPDPLWHLIDWLLAKDPRERPSAARAHSELEGVIPLLAGMPAAPVLQEPPLALTLVLSRGPTVHDLPTVQTPWPASSSASAGSPVPSPASPPAAAQPASRRRSRWLAAAAMAVVVLAGGAAWAVGRGDDVKAPGRAAGPATSPAQTTSSRTTPSTAASSQTTSSEPDPSTEAPASGMPTLVGLTLSAAQPALPAGVVVEVRDVIDPSEIDGTVVAQDPAAGQPIGDTVTVDVARQHITRYLADLPVVTIDDFQSGSYDANGQTYAHSLAAHMSYYGDQAKSSYNLGRHYRRLVGTLGLSDTTEDPKAKISFEVFADGRKVFDKTVPFGSTVELDLDVTNVLRLEVVNGKIALDGAGLAVWGDLHLLGVPGEVPTEEQ